MEGWDTVVVGGGVAGSAVAYYLAHQGLRVALVEREEVAAGASGFSAGALNPLQGANIPGPLGPFAMASFRLHLELWGPLVEESGLDFYPHRASQVRVALTEEDLPALEEDLRTFKDVGDGFAAHELDPRDLRMIEPRLAPHALKGVYVFGNGVVDSRLFTLALCRAAQRRGAQLVEGEAVGLVTQGQRVTGVRLADGGRLDCGAVVVASGPWAAQAGSWLGVPLPVEPVKGEIVRVRLPGAPLTHDFFGPDISVYRRPDGLAWLAATVERRGFDREPSDEARSYLMSRAVALMPQVSLAKVVVHTACLRPIAPDWLPLVGRAPGWDNVYLATGGAKKGILLAPGMGRAVADLVTAGETELPIEALDPARFAQA